MNCCECYVTKILLDKKNTCRFRCIPSSVTWDSVTHFASTYILFQMTIPFVICGFVLLLYRTIPSYVTCVIIVGFPFLNTGITLATFSLSGNTHVLKTCVSKSVRGLIMVGASFLNNLLESP